MDVDVPKWRGEIIAGWKGDEDEVVNIDDEDGGLGEYGDSIGLHRQDAGHTTENGGLELASILTFGNRKEDNVSLEPWNEGALFQAHHVVTSSELRSQSQCHSHGHCEAASTEKDNPSRNGTEVGGKRMCMEMEPSSLIQNKRERLSTVTPHTKIIAAGEEGIKKCGGNKCEVSDAKSDHLQQLGGENQQQRGSSKSWVVRGNTSEELLVAATESGRQQLDHDDHVKDGTPSPRTPCQVVNKVLITAHQLLNDAHEGGDFPGLGESEQDDGKKQMEFEHKSKQSLQNEQHQSGAEGGRNLEVQSKGDAAFENQVGMKRMRESRGRVQERNVREKAKFAKECDAAQHVHERLPVDIEILPQKRIVVYDTLKKELELSDGGVLRIDPESLGKIFKKSSIGPMPRECIRVLGTEKVRSRFPRRGRSSKGLDFTTLDQNCEFAKRLKDTWIREYDEESFVIMLRMRFVAACLMEESGSPVNWAADLSRQLGGKIRDISSGKSLGLSAFDHRVLLKILESTQEEEGRQSSAAHGEAARERVESSGEESTMDWMEYNHLCQKCNFGGELLCCDGKRCRNTFHLGCLDPPLLEVPTSKFFCPSCSQKRSVVKAQGEKHNEQTTHSTEHQNHILRGGEPSGAVELANQDEKNGSNCGSNGALSEIISVPRVKLLQQEIEPKDTQLPEQVTRSTRKMHIGSNTEEGQPFGKESQITNITVINCTTDSTPGKCHKEGYQGTETHFIEQIEMLPPRTVGAPTSHMQLVNEDKQHSSHCETSLLQAPVVSKSMVHAFSSEKSHCSHPHEGQIAPFMQFEILGNHREGREPATGVGIEAANAVQTANEKFMGNDCDTVGWTHESTMGKPLVETSSSPGRNVATAKSSSILDSCRQLCDDDEQMHMEEFPSSDDHNSLCEECDTGGELILCDGRGCRAVYHKDCLDPPLEAVPAGEWYCPQCEFKRKGGLIERIWAARKVGTAAVPCNATATHRVQEKTMGPDKNIDLTNKEPFREDRDCSDQVVGVNYATVISSSQQAQKQHSLEEIDDKVNNSELRERYHGSKLELEGEWEYLVQWKSRSHAHNKWLPEAELIKLGPKELARFRKSLAQGQVDKWNPGWAQPERVIKRRQVTDGGICRVEWLVKWTGLGYEQCTWEPADAGILASPDMSKLFLAYEQWTKAASDRISCKRIEEADRLHNKPLLNLDKQPDWILSGHITSTQLDALNQLREWWHNCMNGILVDEGSQEKMVTTILFILSLVEDFRVVRPTLIVVHVGLLSSWEQELRLWAPKLNLVSYATKNEEARDVIRRVEFNLPGGPFKPDIVLTTFEVLNADMEVLEKVDWEVLIVDEARRPRPQKAFRAFCQLSSVFRLLLLSETLKMNVEELSQCIAFLEPENSDVMCGQEGALIAELQQQLRGRLREYTPTTPLAEYWVPVELTHVHLRQYCDILVKNFPALSRNRRDQCSTQIQTVVAKLRQSCNHPFLADATLEAQIGPGLTPREILEAHIQMSGKMRLLHLILPILQSAGWRVVIFAQETKQLNILDKYMLQLFGADSFEQVDSDMAVNHKQLATQRFNSDSSKQFVFLLKSGIHISLRNVQLVIIYDSDWNPENDTRALKKVHFEGIGGKKPLAVFRLYTELTVEENILALSHDKKIPVISSNSMVSAKVCHRVLMRGVKEIFDLYDHAETTTHLRAQSEGSLGGFKGNNLQDLSSRRELQRVWYNAERARRLVYGALTPEVCGGWSVRDELLGSIFSSREDMVPVFTESHVVLDTRKSVEGFWTSLLKWRHEEWQAQEVNNLGKGHRERRKVAYSEEALASAAYTKAQVTEEREGRLQRLQRTGGSDNGDPDWSSGESPENRDTEFFNSTQPCTDEPHEVMDANDLDREEENHSCLNDGSSSSHDKELSVSTSGGSTPSVLPTTDTAGTSPKTTVTDVGVSLFGRQQEGSTTATAKCIQLIDAMMTTLTRLCQALKLPENVANHARDLVMHVSKMSSLLKDKRSHYEIVALDLALCWVAAHDLHHPLNKRATIKSAEAEMGIKYKYVDQLEETLYQKLKGMCANYHAPASQPSAPVPVELVVPSLQEGSPVVTSSVHPEMLMCNSKDAAALETTVKELSSSPSVGSEASPCLQPQAPSGGSEPQAQEPGLSVPNIGSGTSQSLQPKTQSGGGSFPSKLHAQQSLASMQLLRSPGAVAETTQTSQPQTGSAQCAKDATSDTSFEQSYQLQQPDEPQLLPNLGFAAFAGLQQPQAWSGVPSQVQVQEVALPSSSPLQTTPFLLPESQQQMFSTELLLSERPEEQISGMWPRAQTVEMQHIRAVVKGQTKETERFAQRTEKEKEVMRRKLEVASASVMKHAEPGPILEQLQKFSDFDVRVLNQRLAEERNLMEFRHGMELGKLKELHAVQRSQKDNRSAVPAADVFALESEVKTICEYYSQLLASSQDTNTPSPLLSTTPVSLGMLSVQSATSSLVTLPHEAIEQNERQQQMQQQSSCPPILLGVSGDKPSGGLSSSSLPSGQYEKAYHCLESRIALSLPIPVSRGPTPVSAAAGQNANDHLVSESTRIAAPAPISIPRAPTLVSASAVQYESSHLVSESTRIAVTEASVPISRVLTSASAANNTHYENARPVLEPGFAVPIPVPVSRGRSSASTATGQSESAHQVLEPGISAPTHVHESSTLIPSSIAMVVAASASSHPSSAILVREQEKLSSVANKLKGLFQEETKRIKAQYDKEAEQLHRRYEALLTEEHQLFSEKQKMLQHDIAKMDLYLQSMHGSSTTPSQGGTYTVASMPQQTRSVAACVSASAAKLRSLAQQQPPAAGTLPVFQTTGSSSRVQFVGGTSGLATTTNSRTPPCVAGATISSHPAPEANTPPSFMENLPSCHAGVAVITRPSKNMLQVGVTHVPTVAVTMSSRLREQTHHMPDNSSTQLAAGLNSSSERGGNSLVGTEMHPAMPASLIYLSDSEDEQ